MSHQHPPAHPLLLIMTTCAGGADFKAHPLHVVRLAAAAVGVPHVVKEIAGPDFLGSYVRAIREVAAEHNVDALATGACVHRCSARVCCCDCRAHADR